MRASGIQPVAGPVGPVPGRFTGRAEFQQQVRATLASAARDGWPEMILCDATFEDWPLGERAVAESLRSWSASGRRCTLIARRYDELVRAHPRFVSWRRTWSHLVEARGCATADPFELPSVIWSPRWTVHRIDPYRSVGVSGSEPERAVLLRERLADWLARSSPSFAATTLGL